MSGSHTRSLNNQRQPKPRERTSDGQPENLVGRFWLLGIGIKQTQALGSLEVPHREQAHSYNWIEHNLKKQVGCQAAFACRLAPTEKQKQKIAAFGSSYTMSASSSTAFDLDPPATSEG
jgi:hypothetical protein